MPHQCICVVVKDCQNNVRYIYNLPDFVGERIHPLTFLEGNNNIRRSVSRLHLGHQFNHVEGLGQLLEYLI